MTTYSKQKFFSGDVVKIADDLGPSMRHFRGAGQLATVVGSYADQFGGSNTRDYTLRFGNGSQSSWYHEHQLTLVTRAADVAFEEWGGDEHQRYSFIAGFNAANKRARR